ncbi:hypothetical protein D11S_2209 [Aggregatibacter phage S1249]|nr:hypothetical protein D11S_2209 [Aggregatibacter phage S1249]ACX80282.1 hypothetical protein D11S_2209 [Aggregatibacter phage S1249]
MMCHDDTKNESVIKELKDPSCTIIKCNKAQISIGAVSGAIKL